MRIRRIDHVGMAVEDLGAARALLVEVLGFELERDFSVPGRVEGAILRRDGVSVELMDTSPARSAPDVSPEQVPRDHLALEVEDLEAAVAELRARGVETTRAEASVSGSTRSFFTRPETCGGVALQFFERS